MKNVTITIPESPQETAQLRAEAAAAEEKRAREALAKSNRERDLAEPKAGGSLFVATARGLRLRARAGLAFSPTPAEVKVADVSDAEIARRQKTGEYVVNAYGAEQILADSNAEHLGLVVFGSKNDASAAVATDISTEALEAELARRKASARDGEPRIGSQKKAGEGTPPAANRGKANEGDK